MSRRFTVYVTTDLFPFEESAGDGDPSSLSYVYIDWLEPVFQSVVSNGEMGELRCFASKHPEEAFSTCRRGCGIRILDTENSNAVVFNGIILKNRYVYGGDSERFEVVAYNTADYFLNRVVVHGQYRLSAAKEQSYFNLGFIDGGDTINDDDVQHIDTPLIFNPDGEPNRQQQTYNWAGGSVFGLNSENTTYLFDAPFRKQYNSVSDPIESVAWTLSAAVAYLFNNYPAFWALSPNSYGDSALDVITENGDPVISNVNLEGRTLMDALRTLLIPHNYGFYISPNIGGSGYQELFITYRGNATSKTVRLSVAGTDAKDSDANLINADITEDASGVINHLKAVGDRISVTTLAHTDPPETNSTGDLQAMKLVPGWKLSDLQWGTVDGSGHVNPYAPTFRKDYCNEYLITKRGTGPTAKGIYGIGRLWLVNQGQNPSYDLERLSADLGTWNSIDLRRLEQPELYDRNITGALLNQTDIVVEMSFDGGKFWRLCEQNWYRVLPQGMGIVFTNVTQIELLGFKWVNENVPSGINYWQGLYDSYYNADEDQGSALQIRILCGVKSDERVKSTKLNDGAAFPLAVERQFENTGYQKVVYNELINDAVYYVDFPPARNIRDDTDALGELADVQLSNTNRELVTGQFVVKLDQIGEYNPLDQISAITNRRTFDWPPTILRVIYDFPSQHVHLVVDSRMVKSVLKAAPLDGQDLRQKHFGIGAIGGGQGRQVPFLPGIDSSMRDYFMRKAGENQ